MIGSVNTGGGAETFAFIVVTYLSGSTCTCTCEEIGKVLRAKDTSGSWVFDIPYAGTWTVRSGTDMYKTFSIHSKGQTEICVLRVPNIYQEVEYIDSSGTQYIMSGLYGTEIDEILIDFMAKDKTGTTLLCGCETLSGKRNYLGKSTIRFILGAGDNIDTSTTYSANVVYSLDAFTGYGDIFIKNYGETIWSGTSTVSDRPDVEMCIFAQNTSGSIGYKSKIYLYHVLFKKNGVTVFDGYPVYLKTSNTTAGLFDVVSWTFKGNSGTGNFGVGGDVN